MLPILFSILLIVIFCKWILFIGLLPFQKAYAVYQSNKKNKIAMLLCLPYYVVNTKLCRGGYELYFLYKVGLVPFHHFRNLCYKMVGVKMAKHSVIYMGAKIRSPHKLKIGEGSIIGDNATLDARSGLVIGKNVNLSSNVSIWTLQHDYRKPDFGLVENRRLDVRIEDRAWLGCNVIVLPGVTIGEGAVCCGGCVVKKDVPPYTVVAGIPAKKVGERTNVLTYEFDGMHCRLW